MLQVKLALVATSSSALNSARSESGTPKSAKSKTPRTERSGHERSPRRKTRRSDNSDGCRENQNSLTGCSFPRMLPIPSKMSIVYRSMPPR